MNKFCEEIQNLGKGIGNGNRYQILEALMRGQRTVGQIVKSVGLKQPAVSQHLRTLKSYGLVTDKRHGQKVYYAINVPYTLGILKNFFIHLNRCKKIQV